MGWSTNLFCNIEFNRETFNNKYSVLDKIDDLKRQINVCKEEIKSLVYMTEPKKFCPEDCDPITWINISIREQFEFLEEYTIELYKLELLLENWDTCHNEEGLAIDYPENIHWDSAFLEGDFINSVKRPNANQL